jgi:hypothetical protein
MIRAVIKNKDAMHLMLEKVLLLPMILEKANRLARRVPHIFEM